MKPGELTAALNTASNVIKQNEKFAVPVLAARAEKYAQFRPHDTALVMTAKVLTKMAANKTFITRAELNKIYEQFYTSGSKLKEIFASELARPEPPQPKMMPHSSAENQSIEYDYSKVADPFLANALAGAFENKEILFSKDTAKKAENVCRLALTSLGMAPVKMSTFSGKDGFILCTAIHESIKGLSNTLIPVQIEDDKALLPNMFVSRAGFKDLTKEALAEHVDDVAGKSFKVNHADIMQILKVAKNGMPEPLNDVDLAMIKLRQQNHNVASSHGILLQEVEAAVEPIKLPKLALKEEDQKFIDQLSNTRGQAGILFGNKTVAAADSMLQRKMAEFGFRSAQMEISSVAEDSIAYTIAVDSSKSFKVPVKIENGVAMPPAIAISNNRMAKFTKSGLNQLFAGECDSGAKLSRSYELKSSELLEQVERGIEAENQSMIDDAMNILADKDIAAYKQGLDLVMASYSGVKPVKNTCSMIVNSSVSSESMCGHLNLPLSKVCQDSGGYCRPLHRKGQPERGDDRALFVASKLLGVL